MHDTEGTLKTKTNKLKTKKGKRNKKKIVVRRLSANEHSLNRNSLLPGGAETLPFDAVSPVSSSQARKIGCSRIQHDSIL